MTLAGQVALVTGGSRGLGLSICQALASEGAAIGCLARSGAELESAVARLSSNGGKALALAADVTKAAEIEAAVQSLLRQWGRLDVLVLNPGTWQGAPLQQTSEAMWDTLLDLNLKGAFLALRAAIPSLIARGPGGTVVGIGSIGGWYGQAGSAAYSASKWGLRGLLESAALELKPHGVRVSLVHPHQINSAGAAIDPASPERRQNLEPGDVADLVRWICSAPSHVAVGNVTIWPLDTAVRFD